MNKTFSPTKERTIALIIIFLFRNGAICQLYIVFHVENIMKQKLQISFVLNH